MRLARLLSTVGPAGHAPWAPGTCGALAALPLGWLLARTPWGVRVAALAALTALSVWAVDRYVAGDRHADPREVVLDEFVGCLIALAFVPWRWPWVLAAFGLFRLFDITKPGPIRTIDRQCHGGPGIVGDDVAAGLLAGAVLVGARLLFDP